MEIHHAQTYKWFVKHKRSKNDYTVITPLGGSCYVDFHFHLLSKGNKAGQHKATFALFSIAMETFLAYLFYATACVINVYQMSSSSPSHDTPKAAQNALCTQLIRYKRFMYNICTSANKTLQNIFCPNFLYIFDPL